jgi:protein BCP1
VQTIIQYLTSKAASSPQLSHIKDVISSQSPGKNEVGLILAERLLNVPPEVIPPMYTMLMEEVEWANQDNEPYTFSHYLILSKTYKEVESKLDEEESRSTKKQKKDKGASDNTFYFHPEDEVFQRYAVAHGNFNYTSVPDSGRADSKRAFQEMGIVPQGHFILIERSRIEEAVKAVSEFLTGTA